MTTVGRTTRYVLPLVLFMAIIFLLARGLYLDPRQIPSPLIGEKIPSFSLPTLENYDQRISEKNLSGKIFLLNVFASWCLPCLEEHQYLMELSDSGTIDIYGLNYKDRVPDVEEWLVKHGNPYNLILVDKDGNLGIDLGVYGVPETFLIDASGTILYKHVGPLTNEIISSKIITKLQE